MGTRKNHARGRGIRRARFPREFADRIARSLIDFRPRREAIAGRKGDARNMSIRRNAIIVCIMAAMASVAFAEPWAGPDPTRRPKMLGAGDIDFAVAELCFPYVLRNAEVAAITDRPLVVRMPFPPPFAVGSDAFMVGRAGTIVSFRDTPEGRACTVAVNDGDPERLRETLGERLKQMPPLTLAARQLPANQYARRESFCGPPEPPHYGVLISTGGARRQAKLMVTIYRSPVRDRRCDPEPAPTPAPDQAPTPL